METNITNTTPDSNAPSKILAPSPKIKGKGKLLFILVLLAVAGLVFAGLIYWLNKTPKAEKTSFQNTVNIPEQINKEVRAFTTASKITFPNVSKFSKTDLNDISPENKALILDGAAKINVSNIAYENSQTGYYIIYEIASSTVESFIYQTAKFGEGKWASNGGTSSSLVAVIDLQNTESQALAQIRYTKTETSSLVVIKIINQPKTK